MTLFTPNCANGQIKMLKLYIATSCCEVTQENSSQVIQHILLKMLIMAAYRTR